MIGANHALETGLFPAQHGVSISQSALASCASSIRLFVHFLLPFPPILPSFSIYFSFVS